MKAIIFYGGWDGHEPSETSAIFAEYLSLHGVETVRTDSQEVLRDASYLKRFDLIVPVWTMGSLDDGAWAGIREAVLGGTGLGGWHGGMCDAFRNHTDYQYLCGGQWVAHPGGVIDYTVEIVKKEDPVTAGLPASFPMHSEQYYMHTDPGNEVLAVTRFSGERDPWIAGTVMPVAWKRRYGKGRVFFCSLGHTASDFRTSDAALELTGRGLLWAAHAL